MKVSLLFREWLEIGTGYIFRFQCSLKNQVLCYFLYLKKKKERQNLVSIVKCYSMKTVFL